MTKYPNDIIVTFLIAISFFASVCISGHAVSGEGAMDKKTIDEFNEIPTVQDTREASALVRAIKENYKETERASKNDQLEIFYKAKKSSIYLYIYGMSEVEDQDSLVEIINYQRKLFSLKSICISFYSQNFSASSSTDKPLRELKLQNNSESL